MEKEIRNTYYYNVPAGVTPADHNVQYDYRRLVSDIELGDYYRAEARLTINHAKTVDEYLEDITGHYVEGVDSWASAHEYLIDLVQGMVEELVRNSPCFNEVTEYTAVIEEVFPDNTYILYAADIYMDDFDQNLEIDCSRSLTDHVEGREALKQMININAEDFARRYRD